MPQLHVKRGDIYGARIAQHLTQGRSQCLTDECTNAAVVAVEYYKTKEEPRYTTWVCKDHFERDWAERV